MPSTHTRDAVQADANTFLNEDETADLLRISPRTLQRWRITGDGPKWVRLGLRRVGYRRADCDSWAADRTFAHRAAELAAKEAA